MPTGHKKKTKYINVFSNEGKERMIVRLPGRSSCECQATKHKLIGNCLKCGRIVCDQEGSGPCFFCGTLVCTREEKQTILSGTREGKSLEEQLLSRPFREGETSSDLTTSTTSQSSLNDIAQAVAFKDKLIQFDRTSAQRTRVIDDAADYFDSDNKWLSKHQRTKLEKLRSQIDAKKNDKKTKVTIDFAGRRVYNEAKETNERFYEEARAVQENDQYELESERRYEQQLPTWDDDDDLINHNLPDLVSAPQWVEPKQDGQTLPVALSNTTIEERDRQRLRIQDRELMQMTDEGMCLSMHQPWASLLIRGIKMHEGRSWYTSHRGRLWIHAAAKEPDQETIAELETFYRSRTDETNEDELDFPNEYQTSVLLGCVDVIDCLDRETYLEQYPDGESDSDFVLICENPQELFFKMPMRGQHKIYKLEPHAHQAAKKILLRRTQ